MLIEVLLPDNLVRDHQVENKEVQRVVLRAFEKAVASKRTEGCYDLWTVGQNLRVGVAVSSNGGNFIIASAPVHFGDVVCGLQGAVGPAQEYLWTRQKYEAFESWFYDRAAMGYVRADPMIYQYMSVENGLNRFLRSLVKNSEQGWEWHNLREKFLTGKGYPTLEYKNWYQVLDCLANKELPYAPDYDPPHDDPDD